MCRSLRLCTEKREKSWNLNKPVYNFQLFQTEALLLMMVISHIPHLLIFKIFFTPHASFTREKLLWLTYVFVVGDKLSLRLSYLIWNNVWTQSAGILRLTFNMIWAILNSTKSTKYDVCMDEEWVHVSALFTCFFLLKWNQICDCFEFAKALNKWEA